jgi:hypothetical protein
LSALPPEPPDEQLPPPPPPPEPVGGECPRCGTPFDPYQEYCLECGLRLPITRGLIPVLSTAWQRRVPWYPGDWIWPVLAALVIAMIAAGVAIAATNDNGSPRDTSAATNATVPTETGTNPPPSGTETSPTGSVPTTAPTAPEPAPPPPPASGGALTEWPPGQNGWTIVLVSSPQSAGRAAANREAQKAVDAGLSDVGVINSSEFASLRPGYFVVFSGIYSSEKEARAGLDSAKGSYPQAYARQIVQ